ncbi:MAG: Rrf2 family transcriptional regulator [Proteobacteria bacterium]|nr:Rrf2 family transcriptional regulator [Pseudomonadota bacterium]
MHLTTFTDYCLRVLMYVAVAPPGRRATVPEVAAAFGISRSHLSKVVHLLGKAGVLHNVRGRRGGLELARPAGEINVGAVVRLVDDRPALVECFDRTTNRCVITPVCRLRDALGSASDAFYATLDRYTIADITQHPRPLAQVLHFERRRAGGARG